MLCFQDGHLTDVMWAFDDSSGAVRMCKLQCIGTWEFSCLSDKRARRSVVLAERMCIRQRSKKESELPLKSLWDS